MVLGSGKRRHYITIQVATETSDSQGGYTTSWTNTYNEWADIRFLSGSRTLDQGGIKYTRAIELTVRSRTDYTLSGANRISWNSEYWTIHSVLPSEKLNDLKVLAYA